MRTPRTTGLVVAVLGLVAAAACSPQSSNTTAPPTTVSNAARQCAVDKLHLYKPGQLTIATDSPAYDPWYSHNDPTNGKGYESAVAYALAGQMGFSRGQVHWVTEPFNSSYQPGPKKFDFDINQISITPSRAKRVTFSSSYYNAAQAIIVMKNSAYAHAKSFADFANAQLGAQVGTTSLDAIGNDIKPSSQPRVYDDTNAATKALQNGQVDGIVADLPSAYYITAAVLSGSTIVGQFQPQAGSQEQFGLLFAKNNPLVSCVDASLAKLKSKGTLSGLEQRWLSQSTNVPVLK
ncbi:MAG: ABC transporter substrate-binding protein [Nocardioidaceae bacterium]